MFPAISSYCSIVEKMLNNRQKNTIKNLTTFTTQNKPNSIKKRLPSSVHTYRILFLFYLFVCLRSKIRSEKTN